MAGERICGVLHGGDAVHPIDADGCLLIEGHEGPHEFVDLNGRLWLWETDMECDCSHCRKCDGDYCTIYWRKPIDAASTTQKGNT